jgi:D-arabinose 5-phosphate isomerase GutQ
LTHHLVQDQATDEFLLRLLALTLAHPAARWLDAGEVFAPGVGRSGIAASGISA